MTIHLGRPLPNASCDLPGWQPENMPSRAETQECHPFLVLLPVGFTMPPPLPGMRCALTTPFHPYRQALRRCRRYAFCCTFPGVAPAGRYPAPCFRGARTFLPPTRLPAAKGDHPTVWRVINSDYGTKAPLLRS